MNVETPASIVDINALPELRGFDTSGSNELVFGALARMSDVAADRVAWCATIRRSRSRCGGRRRSSFATWRASAATSSSAPDAPISAAASRSPATSASPAAAAPLREGINRGHALLGGSEACIAVYPGDWAVALSAFDAKVDMLGPKGERTIAR